jgi:transposase InsO family protein
MTDEHPKPIQSAAWTAALIIRARQEEKRLGLSNATADEVVQALQVSRSRAYALAADIADVLPCRGPGRPRKEETDSSTDEPQRAVSQAVKCYLLDHPGTTYLGRKRRVYTDAFRRFVLDLVGPGGLAEAMPVAEAAEAIGIPVHTLNGWLYGGPKKLRQARAKPESKPAEPPPEPTSAWDREAAKVIALYDDWKGNFSSFCDTLAQHGIDLSRAKVSQILFVAGRRKARPRNRHRVDAEAVRGALERFFPNAQVSEDGTCVKITVNEATYTFSWQLVTDVSSTAHLGFAVRDAEDGKGFVNSMDQAKQTAGAPPEAALRDNRKCNVSNHVEDTLNDEGVISMTSRKGRPQTIGSTEGAFSLFKQAMPHIELAGDTPRELARSALTQILTAYCAGRNLAPRKSLDNRTPAQAYADNDPDESERDRVQRRLRELKKRSRRSRKPGDSRREDVVLRQQMVEALNDLSVSDPRKGTLNKLVSCGLDASLEAVAIVKAKLEAGKQLGEDPQRYLLRIAVNVANRNEDLAAFEHLIELRRKAGELILEPLEQRRRFLRDALDDGDYFDQLVSHALEADSRVDRHFWWKHALGQLATASASAMDETARWMARRVATRYQIHYLERDALIAQVAKVASSYPG